MMPLRLRVAETDYETNALPTELRSLMEKEMTISIFQSFMKRQNVKKKKKKKKKKGKKLYFCFSSFSLLLLHLSGAFFFLSIIALSVSVATRVALQRLIAKTPEPRAQWSRERAGERARALPSEGERETSRAFFRVWQSSILPASAAAVSSMGKRAHSLPLFSLSSSLLVALLWLTGQRGHREA